MCVYYITCTHVHANYNQLFEVTLADLFYHKIKSWLVNQLIPSVTACDTKIS